MQKRYEKYKDSGIEWIGEVPEHWEVKKLGYKSRMIVPMRDKPTEFNGIIPWIRIEDVDDKYIYDSKSGQRVSKKIVGKMNLKVYPPGTVLCTCSCNMGATAIVGKPMVSNQTFIGIVPKKALNSEFLYYLMNANSKRLQYLATGAIQQYLSRHDFEHFKLSFPTIIEQEKTVCFLNQKTSEIDSLIADKEKLIQRLQEYKQSVITEAVTKGLNPDVKMKDSGVEWIGEVPEHWEVKRLKDFAQVSRGTVDKNINEDEIPVYLVPYTSIYNKQEQRESDDDYLLISVTENELNNSKVIKGDILLTASSETPDDIGRSTVVYDQLSNHVFGSDILRIRISEQIMVLSYRKYLMENHIYLNKFNSLCRGVTRFRFGMNDFKTIRYPLPPIQEQNNIADYLDKTVSGINSLTEDTRKQIDLLKEYRQSLIYEAVTGKIDVRDYNPEKNQPERSENLA